MMGNSEKHRTDAAEYGTERHFCTLFDSGYLPAGIALYESLASKLPSLDLWVLCLDDMTHDILDFLDLKGIHCVKLADIESFDSEFAAVKNNRTAPEYYFTSKPVFINYLFETADPPGITYLDSDLYFFRSPAELGLESREAAAVVHAHNFPADRTDNADRVGRYNAGFVSVRNDEVGQQYINGWRERCLEWCYDRVEDDKYADQKYLEDWPTAGDADVIDRPGAGTARWNLKRWSFSVEDDNVLISGDPLVFYHFEALQQLTERVWNPHVSLPPVVERHVYRPYIRHRMRVKRQIEKKVGYEIDDMTYRLGLIARGYGLFGDLSRTLYRTIDTIRAGVAGELLYIRSQAGSTDAH